MRFSLSSLLRWWLRGTTRAKYQVDCGQALWPDWRPVQCDLDSRDPGTDRPRRASLAEREECFRNGVSRMAANDHRTQASLPSQPAVGAGGEPSLEAPQVDATSVCTWGRSQSQGFPQPSPIIWRIGLVSLTLLTAYLLVLPFRSGGDGGRQDRLSLFLHCNRVAEAPRSPDGALPGT